MEQNHFNYPVHKEPIVLSKALFDTLLQTDYPSETLALYSFYYYTAKWQKTTRVRAVTSYAAKGLKWTEIKVRKIKKILIGLGLIRDFLVRTEDNLTIKGWYIEINIIWDVSDLQPPEQQETYTYGNLPCGIDYGVGFRRTNALKQKSSLNALIKSNKNNNSDIEQLSLFKKEELITPKLFEVFWSLYPNKAGKGTALSSWTKLCTTKSKANVLPTWKSLRQALTRQKKSELWTTMPQYIPHASTWLNNNGWLNDPKEMIVYKNKQFQKANSVGFVGNEIKYKEPKKM